MHWLTGFREVVREFAAEHEIPVRCVDATFVTGFYGRSLRGWSDPKNVSPERLMNVLKELPPGVHEIMCHPGYVDDGLVKRGTSYLRQREAEVAALTSREVKTFVDQNKDRI